MEKAKRCTSPTRNGLQPNFSGLSMWAFSIGTAIGWGSLVVTCNTYLAQAGVLGTVLGLVLGMLVILVITRNLQYMICRNQDAGGIYTYTRKVCGHDYGFLAAWFLLLTYMSILWANITSVPVFARYFLGDPFRIGFHYTIFGYEVYLGEALLSIAAITLVVLFCANFRKATRGLMIASAFAFAAGFTFCTVWALTSHSNSGFSFEPMFVPETNSFVQTVRIAVISPWAFIGFENIAHFSEEYSFKVRKVRGILTVSVVMTTVLYILVTLLSVTAYPPEYASWLDYIKDMDNLTGFKAVPAFYAINHYLGGTGVTILMTALLGAILTSLIGNTLALSRLLYAAGRDGGAPSWLGVCNEKGIPSRAIYAVLAVSVLIPFIGRTAIGWIVDITTLGATIIYGLVSYAVFKDTKESGVKLVRVTGIIGLAIMLLFGVMLLLPNLFSFSEMASESYILFDVWAIIGLIYFRVLVSRDRERQYGHSVLVWVILLLFVLFASMMWVTKATQNVTNNAMEEIHEFYQANGSTASDIAYLKEQGARINSTNALFTIASFAVFILSSSIILSNYQIMRRKDMEHTKQLTRAETKASTDQLTGVKNRHAYSVKVQELNARIAENSAEFAIAICDINDLKLINDLHGHNAGDQCIIRTCKLICSTFKHSPVYRIGGDEFAVILENEDYANRLELIDKINRSSEGSIAEVGSTLAVGMTEFTPGSDATALAVITRADGLMYKRKTEMKRAGTVR